MNNLAKLFFVILAFVATAAQAEEANYGACRVDIPALLYEGGAIAEVTEVVHDRTHLKTWYKNSAGGTTSTFYFPSESEEAKVKDGWEERLQWVESVFARMESLTQLFEEGRMWYLVVNRVTFADQGLPPTYEDPEDPEHVTPWRPYLVYEHEGKCVWDRLDIAIFIEDLPEPLIRQLPGYGVERPPIK